MRKLFLSYLYNSVRNLIPTFSHFPSFGSDDPPPPLGVKNVKIQENSEKIRGPPGDLRDPLQPF